MLIGRFLSFFLFVSLVLPSQPQNVRAVNTTQTSLRLSWQPGFGGDYPIIRCSVQVRQHEINVRGGEHNNWLRKQGPKKSLQLFDLHVKQTHQSFLYLLDSDFHKSEPLPFASP